MISAMDIVILLLALTVTTGLAWSLVDATDRWWQRDGRRRTLTARRRPW
ncbi:MAG: hypothetical protein ACTHNS_12550 [Marmoricola sp.]